MRVAHDGLILAARDGSAIKNGATLNSPERVEIANPTPGRSAAVVVGFTIHRKDGKPEDPDLTLVTVPGAGHFVQQDAADLVTNTMRWWLTMRAGR
jgi:hypothetical protein